ncbi:MAG: hypothetical protein GY820_03460 [Gammaproteobacteria bacterium]|nr:hypothetical protein [Gammaproteobacteria bacterium]
MSLCPKLDLDQIRKYLCNLAPLTESILLDLAEILINLSDWKARKIGKEILTAASDKVKKRRVTTKRKEIRKHLSRFLENVRCDVHDFGAVTDGSPAKVPGAREGKAAVRRRAKGAVGQQGRRHTKAHRGEVKKRGRKTGKKP